MPDGRSLSFVASRSTDVLSTHLPRRACPVATAKTMGQGWVVLGEQVRGQSEATGVCRRSVTGNG